MPKDLPPLTALRAFEAAGRHLSITRAADELCVTAAAVSHQVKTLEDYLEVRLFRRTGNSLFLTDAGQAFLPGLRAGFAELERAMSALREHDLRGAFVLSVAPVFATRWLIPRLDGFHGDTRTSTCGSRPPWSWQTSSATASTPRYESGAVATPAPSPVYRQVRARASSAACGPGFGLTGWIGTRRAAGRHGNDNTISTTGI